MKIHTDWIGVLLGVFLALAISLLVFMLTLLFIAAYEYDHPKTYGDTVEYLMNPIQIAKKEATRRGDHEKLEYWSNLEKELSDKVIEESMEGNKQ